MKKLFLLAIIILLPVSTHAMTRPICSAAGANANALSNRWISFDTCTGNSFASTDALMRTPVSIAGTIGDAVFTMGAPGAGTSFAFTLYKNGSATGQTCTIANTSTTCTATGGTTVAPSDTFSWQASPSGGPTGIGPIQINTSLVGTNADETSIGGATAGNLSNSATAYYSLFGASSLSVEASSSIPEPVAGTIDKLYIETSAVPGTAKSYQFKLYKNGIATGLTATVSGNTLATANDTTDTVSVSANDLLSMEVIPSGTPTAVSGKWSVRLVPTVDGQSPIMARVSPPSAVANRFYILQGQAAAGSGETSVFPTVAFTLSNLYTTFDIQPGGIASYTLTSRSNNVGSGLTATVSGANLNASDVNPAHNVSVVVGDGIAWSNTRANSPAASFKQTISAIAFIAPSASNSIHGFGWIMNGFGWLGTAGFGYLL